MSTDNPTTSGTPDPGEAAGDLARVHYLPAHRDDTSPTGPDGPVLDGEVITDEEYQRLTSQKGQALQRWDGYRQDVTVVVALVRTAVTHQRTRTTTKALARNVFWYPIAGCGVVIKRWRDTHGASRYERMMQSAEAAGDQQMLLEWEARDVAEKQRRHQRTMDWVTSPAQLVKAIATAILAVAGLLLALGVVLAVADRDIDRVLEPILGLMQAVRWAVWFLTAYGILLVTGVTAAGIAYLWHLGRTRTQAPAWVAAPTTGEAPAGRDVVPDESAVLNALRNLNLAPLNRKVKEGWQPRWVQGAVRDGKGWRAQLLLPEGVTVEMIVDKKDVLAHNLLRLPVEVWPTEPRDKPGVLDLWVADQGSLTKPVEPWPLLHKGTTDYFKGVPVGVNPQGKVVTGRLFQANHGVAGMMGSGKSTLIITMLLGAMLDPLVEIDVVCMAFNADYDPLEPRLRSLVKGDEDQHIRAALELLREVMSDLSVRGRRLSAAGEPKLTRELAERDPGMRPRVVVIDECQELFMHPVYGEEAAELVEKMVAKARKYGVTMLFATPVPSADSLPRKVAKVLSHRACFAINDHQGNDAILGTGKHKAGITATTLRPMTQDGDGTVDLGDIGTAMTCGFMPTDSVLRCFYVARGSGVDEVTPVVQRALALREKAGITPAGGDVTSPDGQRDPLADIATVLGGQSKMRTQEVLQRLTELHRPTYSGWGFADLKKYLLAYDAAPYKTDGSMHVRADLVHQAITERDRTSGVEDEDTDPDD